MKTAACLCLAGIVAGCMVLHARTAHTGHLIVSLTDRETGGPITNATVKVRFQTKMSFAGHSTPPSCFSAASAKADSNGVANVEFQFYYAHFDWWVRSPTHYCSRYRMGAGEEHFGCVVEKSDYLRIDTNTVQGLAMYNELVQLDRDNDYMGFVNKFKPKSVTFTNTVVVRSASFFPKRNPQPMYSYGMTDGPYFPRKAPTTIATNGLEVSRCEPVGFDMKECLFVPCHPEQDVSYRGMTGSVADFRVERFVVTTNGVKTTYGWIDFAPGCGAYKRKVTGDESFPTTYEADTNATFLSHIPFECSSVSGKVVHIQRLLEEGEYMVLRTRVMADDSGVVTNCNYSKILGPMSVTDHDNFEDCVVFKSLIFNQRPNDPNLEYRLRRNLATRGYGSWYP